MVLSCLVCCKNKEESSQVRDNVSISYNEPLHPCERRTKRKKRLLVGSHYFFFSAIIVIIIIIIVILDIYNQSTRYCKSSFHGEVYIPKPKIFQYSFRSCASLMAKTSLIYEKYFFGNLSLRLSTQSKIAEYFSFLFSICLLLCCRNWTQSGWQWTEENLDTKLHNKLQLKQQKVGGLVINPFSYWPWYHIVLVAYKSSAIARLKMVVVIIFSNISTFEDETDGGGGDELSKELGQVPLTLAFAARDSLSKVNCHTRTSNHFKIMTCLQLLYVKLFEKLIFWLSWWIQCFTSYGKITSQQGPALYKVTTRQIGQTNRRFSCLTFKQKTILLVGISYNQVDDPKYAFDSWTVISSPRKCFLFVTRNGL